MQYIQPIGPQGPGNGFGNGYVDKNAGAGIAGSFLSGKVPEHLQIELLNLIAKSALTPSAADLMQVARAIRSQRLNYAIATGSANALTIAFDPAPAGWNELIGVPMRVVVTGTNTGPATLAITGLAGTRNITRMNGAPLKRADIVFGSILDLVYDGTQVQVQGLNPALVPARMSETFATAGTFNWTVPADVYVVTARVWGAGGGGGGSTTTSGAASGGSGGEYREARIGVSPGQVIPIVVGAGGTAGPPPGGGNPDGLGGGGGNSSFGGGMVAGGGGGGWGTVGGVTTSTSPPTTGSGPAGSIAIMGGSGQSGFPTGSGYVGGAGGTAYGSSPPALNAFTGGQNGRFPAGGASGSSANAAGGIGAGGLVIIDY